MDEVFKNPQMLHRKMVVEIEYPGKGRIKQLGTPMNFSETPCEIRSSPPSFGEHTGNFEAAHALATLREKYWACNNKALYDARDSANETLMIRLGYEATCANGPLSSFSL